MYKRQMSIHQKAHLPIEAKSAYLEKVWPIRT